ncbi:GTPase-activating protein [Coemansia sp. RSA 2599]|nr:GTPase-activating protein [Coemansia sp. RSA 2599]
MATLDSSVASVTSSGPLVKKSLRSKRLMRPAAGGAGGGAGGKPGSETRPPLPPVPTAESLAKEKEEKVVEGATPSSEAPRVPEEADYQFSATDTETLAAAPGSSAAVDHHRHSLGKVSNSSSSASGGLRKKSLGSSSIDDNDDDEFVEATDKAGSIFGSAQHSLMEDAGSAALNRPRMASFGSASSRKQQLADDTDEEGEAKIMDFENVDVASARHGLEHKDEKEMARRKSSAASYNPFDAYGYSASETTVSESVPQPDALLAVDDFGASSTLAAGSCPQDDDIFGLYSGDAGKPLVSNEASAEAPAVDSSKDEPIIDMATPNDIREFSSIVPAEPHTISTHADNAADGSANQSAIVASEQKQQQQEEDEEEKQMTERQSARLYPSAGTPTIDEASLESMHAKLSHLTDTANGSGNSAREYPLGRSTSMRYGTPRSSSSGRRRPSLSSPGTPLGGGTASSGKSKNRRSIMLTSFVPPVGISGGLSSSSPQRNSGESQADSHSELFPSEGHGGNNPGEIVIAGKTIQRSSLLADGGGIGQNRSNRGSTEMGMTSIRLRPSSDVSGISGSQESLHQQQQQLSQDSVDVKSAAKSALQSISERIGSAVGVIREEPSAPEWLKEVQRRKREAKEKEEAARATAAAAAAAAVAASASIAPEPVSKNNSDDDDMTKMTDVDLGADNDNGAWPATKMDTDKPLPSLGATVPISAPNSTQLQHELLSVPGQQQGTEPAAANANANANTAQSSSMPARSIYRSLSASLGIGGSGGASAASARESTASNGSGNGTVQNGPPLPTVPERQRATSQTGNSPATAQSGIFAAVSSFFGRSSTTQQPSAPAAPVSRSSASVSASGNEKTTLEFPGMRPSYSETTALASASTSSPSAAGDPAMDILLSQLEAQNQQILKDNKARVFTRETLDGSSGEGEDAAADESADWDFWGNLINNYDRVSKTEPRKLARSVHAGIPKAIRGTVWQLMSGSRSDPALGAAFRRLVAQPTDPSDEVAVKNEKQIKHDLARTFPRLEYFRDSAGAGQEGLFAVLRAYALYDTEVGYCQGLGFVVGPLLLNMPDEEAFCVLARLMYTYGLRGHFLPTMDDLQLRLYQFDHVLRETLPRLARHFQQQGVEATMYVSQWLMTMFAYRLPIELTFRLFDVVFAEGLDALLRMAIAVLKRSQTRLLSLEFEGIMQYLNEGPLFAFYAHASPDMLVRDANQVTAVTPRVLERLRRRYIEELERRLEEEDETNRMRTENESLRQEAAQLQSDIQQHLTEKTALQADAHRLRDENARLQKVVADLESQVKGERKLAEEQLCKDMDSLAQKNVQLTIKNQQLEDSLQDMEAALIQIKLLYAESENQKDVLAKKFEDLRRALK